MESNERNATPFWEKPLSHRFAMLGHLLTLLASSAFAAAMLIRLSESDSLPLQPMPHDPRTGDNPARDFFKR